MQQLAIAGVKLEGFPAPDGRIRVVLHSKTGQQEVFVTLGEWASFARIEQVLDGAGRLVLELQAQRDAAVQQRERTEEHLAAEVRRLDLERAKLNEENRQLREDKRVLTERYPQGRLVPEPRDREAFAVSGVLILIIVLGGGRAASRSVRHAA